MSPPRKPGRTLRALLGNLGPQPLGPIIDPVLLVPIMDQHSRVDLVGQRGPSPGLVPVIELVEAGQNARLGKGEHLNAINVNHRIDSGFRQHNIWQRTSSNSVVA